MSVAAARLPAGWGPSLRHPARSDSFPSHRSESFRFPRAAYLAAGPILRCSRRRRRRRGRRAREEAGEQVPEVFPADPAGVPVHPVPSPLPARGGGGGARGDHAALGQTLSDPLHTPRGWPNLRRERQCCSAFEVSGTEGCFAGPADAQAAAPYPTYTGLVTGGRWLREMGESDPGYLF